MKIVSAFWLFCIVHNIWLCVLRQSTQSGRIGAAYPFTNTYSEGVPWMQAVLTD